MTFVPEGYYLDPAFDCKNISLEHFPLFYCRKHSFYGPCSKCYLLNGGCDYSSVFLHKSSRRFNPCPICSRKGSSYCSACRV